MKRRSDKTGCVNYETSTDYADCIEKVVTDKLIKVLGKFFSKGHLKGKEAFFSRDHFS